MKSTLECMWWRDRKLSLMLVYFLNFILFFPPKIIYSKSGRLYSKCIFRSTIVIDFLFCFYLFIYFFKFFLNFKIFNSYMRLRYQKPTLWLWFTLLKNRYQDFPGSPVGKTLLPMQGAWVRSLVGELKSRMPCHKKIF